MVLVNVDLSGVDGDLERRFNTYLNYLRQFNLYVSSKHPSSNDLIHYVWKASSSLQGIKGYSDEYLQRSLSLAWNTETIACEIGLQDAETLRINNHWKPIQVYYALYSAGEALTHLNSLNTRFSHKGVLKELSGLFVKLKIDPWGLSFRGPIGRSKKDAVPINFPDNLTLESNLKKNDVDPVSVLATCLNAEHKRRVDDTHEEMKRKNRKNKKYKYQIDPGPTTLFHFSYRLRLRSNYDSAAMYHSNVSDQSVESFDKYLNFFCNSTLSGIEVLILKRIGKKKFFSFVESFQEKVKSNTQLASRIQAYKEL